MSNRIEELKKAFISEVKELINNLSYYDFDCFFEEYDCSKEEIDELISTLSTFKMEV